MGKVKDFFGWVFGVQTTVKHIDLDPESIRKHNTIRALANENVDLKADKGKLLSQLGRLRESKKDQEEEEDVRWELDSQRKELQRKSYPKYFSLKSLFNKLRIKKFKDKLGFYSFDSSTKLGKFGDIGISSSGIVLLNDQNQVLLSGKKAEDIFWSVPGLGTDVSVGKIPLCLDSDKGYVENLMVWDAPILTPTSEGNYNYAKAKKKPFYEYIKELMAEISDKNIEIERLERTNTKLDSNLGDSTRAQRVSEDQAETSSEQLSEAEKTTSAIGRAFRRTEKELMALRDKSAIFEAYINQLEEELVKIREIAEGEATKDRMKGAISLIQDIKDKVYMDNSAVNSKTKEDSTKNVTTN